jgi:hypothetical protein
VDTVDVRVRGGCCWRSTFSWLCVGGGGPLDAVADLTFRWPGTAVGQACPSVPNSVQLEFEARLLLLHVCDFAPTASLATDVCGVLTKGTQ